MIVVDPSLDVDPIAVSGSCGTDDTSELASQNQCEKKAEFLAALEDEAEKKVKREGQVLDGPGAGSLEEPTKEKLHDANETDVWPTEEIPAEHGTANRNEITHPDKNEEIPHERVASSSKEAHLRKDIMISGANSGEISAQDSNELPEGNATTTQPPANGGNGEEKMRKPLESHTDVASTVDDTIQTTVDTENMGNSTLDD